MKRTASALLATALFTPLSYAAMVQETCTLPFEGQINQVMVTDYGLVAVAKLKGNKEQQLGFRYANDESERVRYGSVTTTFLVETGDANCGFNADSVNPLKVADYDRPWRQFQMVQDNGRDRVISAEFSNSYNPTVSILVSEGKQSGDSAPMPQVFELQHTQLEPVPSFFDLTGFESELESGPNHNGRLPALQAGFSEMSIDGDGGNWQYRLSGISDDGVLIGGNVRLKEPANTLNGEVMDKSQQFAVLWELADAELAFGEEYYLQEMENRLMVTPEVTSISYHPLGRESSNYELPQVEGMLDGIVYDADNTMANITQIKQVHPGLYFVAGKSMSGKAMVALVTSFAPGIPL